MIIISKSINRLTNINQFQDSWYFLIVFSRYCCPLLWIVLRHFIFVSLNIFMNICICDINWLLNKYINPFNVITLFNIVRRLYILSGVIM